MFGKDFYFYFFMSNDIFGKEESNKYLDKRY